MCGEMLALNSLYNMDCIEGMENFPDKYFDLAIIDPPYGIGEDGSKASQRGKQANFGKLSTNRAKGYSRTYKPFAGGDKSAPDERYFCELFRVSKNQIIFGANHFISRIPLDSHCWIVWDKQNDATDFADCELAWTSFSSAVRVFRFKWNGMLQGDMKNKEARIHPTQKPVALYSWILQKYAKPGDRILDTHVGSASSLIACHRHGLDFIGFEIDKHYFTVATERLEAEMAQMRFDTVLNIAGGGGTNC
jgi:site-specific DNA-methyltransferase (adenine-specific)